MDGVRFFRKEDATDARADAGARLGASHLPRAFESRKLVLYWKGEPIDVQIPKTMELKITEAAPGAKGNTAQGRAEKPAVLETGVTINVPIFVEEGETIKVDTDDRKYLGRVTS